MISIPVTFDTATRRKDRSVRLAFTTTFEVTNQDFAEMDKLVQSAGWIGFKQNEALEVIDLPKEDAPDNGKKPSQRLRAVLFRVWEQQTDQKEDFEAYYRRIMEELINKYKDLLV